MDKIIEEFLEFYDHKVPDPTHNPKVFAYYVKLFYYYRNKK